MWPWEHAAVGYLLYSPAVRRLTGRPPSGPATVALLCGTQVPDLVDKPLSWGLELFPNGYALGHSVFLAVPLGLAILWVGRRRGRPLVGAAFVTGYWSHLLADVVSPLRTGDSVAVGRVLWPVVVGGSYQQEYGLARGLVYLRAFLSEMRSMDADTLVLLYLLVPALTVGLWLADGRPGVGSLRRTLGRIRSVARRLARF